MTAEETSLNAKFKPQTKGETLYIQLLFATNTSLPFTSPGWVRRIFPIWFPTTLPVSQINENIAENVLGAEKGPILVNAMLAYHWIRVMVHPHLYPDVQPGIRFASNNTGQGRLHEIMATVNKKLFDDATGGLLASNALTTAIKELSTSGVFILENEPDESKRSWYVKFDVFKGMIDDHNIRTNNPPVQWTQENIEAGLSMYNLHFYAPTEEHGLVWPVLTILDNMQQPQIQYHSDTVVFGIKDKATSEELERQGKDPLVRKVREEILQCSEGDHEAWVHPPPNMLVRLTFIQGLSYIVMQAHTDDMPRHHRQQAYDEIKNMFSSQGTVFAMPDDEQILKAVYAMLNHAGQDDAGLLNGELAPQHRKDSHALPLITRCLRECEDGIICSSAREMYTATCIIPMEWTPPSPEESPL